MPDKSDFNFYADKYNKTLNHALLASGESSLYFAQARINWTSKLISKQRSTTEVNNIMDFGCGIGASAQILANHFSSAKVIGVDPSKNSIDIAKKNNSQEFEFYLNSEFTSSNSMNMVYCNGVFHHIPISQRVSAVNYIKNSLSPSGILAVWENNPWNPGTRLIMRKCPFDNDANTLSHISFQKILEENGFEITAVNFLFIFPRILKLFRPLEKYLCRFPIGAQYLILAKIKK